MAAGQKIRDLWRSLEPRQRERVAAEMAALRTTDAWPAGLELELSRILRFRPVKVEHATPDEMGRFLHQGALRLDWRTLSDLFVNLHLTHRPALLAAVYDALGVEHEGVEVVEAVAERPLALEPALARLPELLDRYDPEDVHLCFLVLEAAGFEAWRPVAAQICRQLERRPAGTGTAQCEPAAAAVEAAVARDAPPQPGPLASVEVLGDESFGGVPGFTTLDRVLERSIVAALNGVEGSLSHDELDDLVSEVVALNDARERSRYFAGFLDALLGRALAAVQPGDNEARRGWYLAGFLRARVRLDSTAGAVRELLALDPADARRLLASGSEAGALVAIDLVPELAEGGHVGAAETWIRHHFRRVASKLMPPLLDWARRALVEGDPEAVRRVLEAAVHELPAEVPDHGPLQVPMARALRRRLATAWRRVGRSDPARRVIEGLLGDSTDALEQAGLLSDLAMLSMGIRTLEQVQLGPASGREALLAAIAATRSQLELAADLPQRTPVPPLLLALPAVADRKVPKDELERAIGRIRDALGAMRDETFWRSTGVAQHASFYLSLLELRSLDEGRAPPAADRLAAVFEDRSVELPLDLVHEAVEDLALTDAPGAARSAALALERWPALLGRVQLESLAIRNPPLRAAIRDTLAGAGGERLTAEERWRAWDDLLRAALAASPRDLKTAHVALDELERLAAEGMEERLLALLDDRTRWDPAWTLAEAAEARVRLLEAVGRLQDAAAALASLIHRAISAGEDAEDLIERLRALPAPPEQIADLERRARAPASELAVAPAAAIGRPVRVLFVGGDETQMAYRTALERRFAEAWPGCSLAFEFPGWSSNWGRLVDRLDSRLAAADAVVVMRFVRTHLGRELRRRASERDIPWVACSGHGMQSLERAIGRAVEVARRVG